MPPTSHNTNNILSNTIPAWLRSDLLESIQTIGNIIINIINLEACVKNLEEHEMMETIPKSLSVSIKLQVHAEQQGTIDNVVTEATKLFQKTLLDALLQARRDELNKRRADVMMESTKFKERTKKTVEELRTERCLTGTDEEVKDQYLKWMEYFDSKCAKRENELRTENFFNNKKKEQKRKELNEKRAEERINQELQDPALDQLSKKVTQLETMVKQSSKNEKAKPSGGGQKKLENQNKKGPQRQNVKSPQPQGGKRMQKGGKKTNDPPKKGGPAHANERKGRPPRSTPSTNQSGSRRNTFQKNQK